MRMNRPGVIAAVTFVTTMLVESAVFAASDDREQCAASAEQAQQLRDEGKYRHAREQMLVCARDACPGPIKSDCGKWLSELDRDAPTVVFGARDNKGSDIVDVKVSIDGAPIQERLDGKPVLVDSGEHTFKFESNDGAIKEERVLIRAAEKARPIIATFLSATDPSGDIDKNDDGDGDKDGSTLVSTKEGSVIPALVVGGVGVAALGSFALFGIMGKSSVDDLQKCKPYCKGADVDSARTKLLVADVSLGVGVAALGVATYLFFTRPAVDTSKVQTAAQKEGALRIDGGPITGGGYAGIVGTF